MPGFNQWIADTDGDGYPDDIRAQLVLDLPDGAADRDFWSALLDLAARAGLETQSLSLPLVHDGSSARDVEQIAVQSRESIDALQWEMPAGTIPGTSTGNGLSGCLTDLFTSDGALEDRDGDLLPDASRISFDLPESMPAHLGAAVANLAARIGLESGGLTLPVADDHGARFSVRPGNGEAVLRTVENGWQAEGDSQSLAALLDRVAGDWPHVAAPETGGATFAVQRLRRSLAGDDPSRRIPGEPEWELHWSARREVESLREAFEQRLLPRLDPASPLEVTVFASEPPEQRRQLTDTVRNTLQSAGFENARVTVLCAFKAGLSWLREVVLPAMQELSVDRVRILYQRYDHDGGPSPQLDLPIRWLQELFPGNEILASELGIPVDAVELVERQAPDGPTYIAEALDSAGETLGRWQCSLLHVRQPFIAALPETGNVCVTTGGFVAEQNGSTIHLPVETDMQRFWQFWQGEVLPRILRRIDESGGAYLANQPFFGRLEAEVWISEPNGSLGIREENDSAAEALQEDIYFNTLDTLETYGLSTTGQRTNAPGSVMPVIHVVPGCTPHARVQLRAAPPKLGLTYPDVQVRGVRLVDGEFELDISVDPTEAGELEDLQAGLGDLASRARPSGPTVRAHVTLGGSTTGVWLPLPETIEDSDNSESVPPMDVNIHGEAVLRFARSLAANPVTSAWIEDVSYEGRPIAALSLCLPGNGKLRSAQKAAILKPTCLIVARHHANEISSTNVALRLAHLCGTDPDWRRLLDRVNIVIIPEENPDGAALHAALAADPAARTWKHHPARYNALGYEFSEAFIDPDTRFGEARVRPALWRRWKPDAVVDNHGVPSHEWVQPFSGFGSPPRFRMSYWIPQALIYGIVGYVEDDAYPEHREAMEAVRQAVSAAIRETDLGEWNRIYRESYQLWGQSREPDRFPGTEYDSMLWHISSGTVDPANRRFSFRYPKTTVLSWVTEVNDETATGAHLERTARAHLLANRAMLERLAASAPDVRRWGGQDEDGRTTLRIGRVRPLVLHRQ